MTIRMTFSETNDATTKRKLYVTMHFMASKMKETETKAYSILFLVSPLINTLTYIYNKYFANVSPLVYTLPLLGLPIGWTLHLAQRIESRPERALRSKVGSL